MLTWRGPFNFASERACKLLARYRAGTQDAGRFFEEREHGRFKPDLAWAPIEDGLNGITEASSHVLSRRWANVVGDIGRRSRNRPAKGGKKRQCDGVAGNP